MHLARKEQKEKSLELQEISDLAEVKRTWDPYFSSQTPPLGQFPSGN